MPLKYSPNWSWTWKGALIVVAIAVFAYAGAALLSQPKTGPSGAAASSSPGF